MFVPYFDEILGKIQYAAMDGNHRSGAIQSAWKMHPLMVQKYGNDEQKLAQAMKREYPHTNWFNEDDQFLLHYGEMDVWVMDPKVYLKEETIDVKKCLQRINRITHMGVSDTQVNSGVRIFTELIHDHRMRRDNPGTKVLDVFLSFFFFFFFFFFLRFFLFFFSFRGFCFFTFHRKIVLIK